MSKGYYHDRLPVGNPGRITTDDAYMNGRNRTYYNPETIRLITSATVTGSTTSQIQFNSQSHLANTYAYTSTTVTDVKQVWSDYSTLWLVYSYNTDGSGNTGGGNCEMRLSYYQTSPITSSDYSNHYYKLSRGESTIQTDVREHDDAFLLAYEGFTNASTGTHGWVQGKAVFTDMANPYGSTFINRFGQGGDSGTPVPGGSPTWGGMGGGSFGGTAGGWFLNMIDIYHENGSKFVADSKFWLYGLIDAKKMGGGPYIASNVES